MNIKKLNEELTKVLNEISDETIQSYIAGREAQIDKARQEVDTAYELEQQARENRLSKEGIKNKLVNKLAKGKSLARNSKILREKKTFADVYGQDLTGQTFDGDLNIEGREITSLKGCPKVVNGDLYINDTSIISLEDSPEIVTGRVYIRWNQKLSSLKSNFKEVGDFDIDDADKITSLEGSPEKVNGRFYIYNPSFSESKVFIKNLVGSPRYVKEGLMLSNVHLESLEGAPEEVGYLEVDNNLLTSLEGCPKKVKSVYADNNKLRTLVGLPDELDNLSVRGNKLKSLEGCPKVIKGNLNIMNNPGLKSLEGIGKVKGKLECRSSLKGKED